MSFISDELEAYINDHSEKEPPLLEELNRETYTKVLRPEMLSGHYQGRLLSMLSKLIQPSSILEIGTYTGYSAICLAEGMQKDGILHTIDLNEELFDMQKRFFKRSGYGDNIRQYIGNALEIIPQVKGEFDVVFMDADKENYPNYFQLCADRIRTGGLLIADNVLWYGKVIEDTEEGDEATESLKVFNKILKADQRFETLILPVRDGLTVARKK